MGTSRGFSIAVMLLAVAACASKPPPPPAPPKAAPAPAPKPAPTPAKPAAAQPKKPITPAAVRPSVAAVTSISFEGAVFKMKFQGNTNGEAVRQYYLPAETAQAWTRVVELHVYPTAGKGMTAAAYARLIAKNVQAGNPYARYTLQPNKDGTVTLSFTTWDDASLKAHYREFDAYKFIPVKSGNIIGFHYVERIYTDMKATTEQNIASTTATKQKALLEMAKVPLYQE
ncbi:MAG TPA: hypothetical protein VGT99_13535 [Gammaproteobacteria bacterium]|nr:hypothetical protein [Gammaproteobacteria bacterium]